jgi:GDPmannose 4,6-dehydratase
MPVHDEKLQNSTVLITGVSGQDGSYLAEQLIEAGTRVIGITRDISLDCGERIERLKPKLELQYCSYTEAAIFDVVEKNKPDVIYNLAGQTYVAKSWELVEETIAHSAILPIHFLNAILRTNRKIKFFQASSSEIFESSIGALTEKSPIFPKNPYGCSKAFAHNMVSAYRNHYGIFAVNGIFFHHESPRRNPNFLSRKVVQAAVKIKLGLSKELLLGNLTAARDWGYAPDYMEAIQKIMALEKPDDFVIATGRSSTVQQLVEIVFGRLNLDWKKFVKIDPNLSRSYEIDTVRGNPQKAKDILKWEAKNTLEDVLAIMVDHELKNYSNTETDGNPT